MGSEARIEAGVDEAVAVGTGNPLGVAGFVLGPQILAARLVEHAGADRVASAVIGPGVIQLLLLHLRLAQLVLEPLAKLVLQG